MSELAQLRKERMMLDQRAQELGAVGRLVACPVGFPIRVLMAVIACTLVCRANPLPLVTAAWGI